MDPGEPEAANCLQVGESLVFPLQYPRTAERLRRAGHEPRLVDNRELVKGEGALTCCSLLFRL